MKVWKLPLGTPQSKGKAVINLLPLKPGESIATILPLPEDEDTWSGPKCDVLRLPMVMYAVTNCLIFSNVYGPMVKIAIRFADESDKLIGVAVCTEEDDVLLAAKGGRAIRFKASDIRLFVGRTSTGVRGMKILVMVDESLFLCALSMD